MGYCLACGSNLRPLEISDQIRDKCHIVDEMNATLCYAKSEEDSVFIKKVCYLWNIVDSNIQADCVLSSAQTI